MSSSSFTFSTRTSSVHSFAAEERAAFVRHINQALKDDPDLQELLPIEPHSNQIFSAAKEGVLLSKLLHHSVPCSIDLEKLTVQFSPMTKPFQMLENHRICIDAAKGIGCSIVNISAEDLVEGKPYLVFGLLWQIIRHGLLYHVKAGMLPGGMRLPSDADLPPEALLLRWVNWLVQKSKPDVAVRNLGADLADSEAYLWLIHALKPEELSAREVEAILKHPDLLQRAELMIAKAVLVDPSAECFLRPAAVVKGNEKLNLCFLASLFQKNTGEKQLHEELDGKISKLNSENADLQATIDTLKRRIEELNKESAYWKNQAEAKGAEYVSARKEIEFLQNKFSQAVSDWRDEQVNYFERIEDLESKYADTNKQLKQTQKNLMDERRQAETFGICAESLNEELEGFRSRQEKMEYLIDHLKIERSRSELFSSRLRSVYKTFPTVEALSKAVLVGEGPKDKMFLETIALNADKTGTLTKKARGNSNWRVRFFVLRENFLIYYKSDGEPRAEPKGVIRLDDCSVEFSDNPTEFDLQGKSVLRVTVPYHGHLGEKKADQRTGKLEFYLAGDNYDLDEWRIAIGKASEFWTRKSSIETVQRTRKSSVQAHLKGN